LCEISSLKHTPKIFNQKLNLTIMKINKNKKLKKNKKKKTLKKNTKKKSKKKKKKKKKKTYTRYVDIN